MMERLTARSPKNNMAYLVKVKQDEQDVESPYPNTLRCIMDSFNRLAAYEDSGLSPEQVRELAEAKAIYEAYDGSKLDKADQYIERLETVLEKAKEVLASVSYRSGLGSDEDGIRETLAAIAEVVGK